MLRRTSSERADHLRHAISTGIRLIALIALFFFSGAGVHAAQITLAWNAEAGAAGYKVYYGTESDSYSTSIDVGNVTTYSLALADGRTYYLAATAYDPARVESDFSAEISYDTQSTAYLSVQKGGSGSGRVTSTPSAIDCGPTCGASYSKGAKVTLVPVPDSGSVFVGWAGDCSGTGTCSVTMAADRNVEAVFSTGSCTYNISAAARVVAHKGGAIVIGVTAKDQAGCAAPEVTSDAGWITYTAGAFTRSRGSVKLSIPENDSSIGRSGAVTIGGKTFTVNQKGKPCTVIFDASFSPVLSGAGDSGAFGVAVTPADCEWTAAPATASSDWIHAARGSGKVDYTVDGNESSRARHGTIVVTLAHGRKSFTIRQEGK